jgi:protein SCO1/2
MALSGVIAACGAPSSEVPASPSEFTLVENEPAIRGARRKQSDRFSNIELQTQFGERVSFYDDLIRDKAVIVNFFYTTCAKICPGTTAQLAIVNDAFARWIGEEITMLSISIDPEVDNPARLKEYWELFGSKPGWLMLTGDEDEINRLRRQMGVYDLDPVIDADKAEHAGILTFGNDRTDRWAALPVFMHRERLLETIFETTRDKEWRRALRVKADKSVPPDRFYGRGEVREIFLERNEVLIKHDAIPGLMMAMTMVFEVSDPSLLDGLSVGQSIDFGVELAGGAHRIVSFTVAEPEAKSRERRGVLLSPKRDRADLQASG